MDTKTPEQLAADYAYSQSPRSGPEDIIWRICRDDFLAAYEAAKPKWISVKDRLPEYTPMVLAMCTDGYELAYYGMYGQGWTNTLGTEHLNVTHWQPLPEAPKE